jgi:hypothetical protein
VLDNDGDYFHECEAFVGHCPGFNQNFALSPFYIYWQR